MPGYQTHYFTQQPSSWYDRRPSPSNSKASSPLWLNTTTDGHAKTCTFLPAFNSDPQPPFTPCLTPASSVGESSVASPRLTVTPCEEDHKLLPHVHMYRGDGFSDTHSSDSDVRYSASPLPYEVPFSPKVSTRHQMVNKFSSAPSEEVRPTKKARSTGPTGSIPGTKPSEPFSSSPKKASSSRPPSNKGASSSRRRKGGTTTNETPQPIKFRFVSVQHSAVDPSECSPGAMDEDDQRVHLEEHMEEEVDSGPFEHGPTEFPPRPYLSGGSTISPLHKKKAVGKIPASNLDFLPVLEARFQRLELAIEKYVEFRGQQALCNSQLSPIQTSSTSSNKRVSSTPPSPRSP